MTAMLRALPVSDWGFVRFRGADAKTFLQGLVTADMKALAPGAMLPACVLTPKGMLVADCELYEESPECILAVMRPAAVAGFLREFEKKIRLSESRLERVAARSAWLVIGAGFGGGRPWPRLNEPSRLLIDADPPADVAVIAIDQFHALRIASGFPWFGADIDGETLPLEGRQDAAISLDKGCYMGQETVSRLVHRGHVNRLLVALRFEGAAPAPGTPLTRDGRDSGRVTSASGATALAMVRYDDAAPGTVFDAGGRRAEAAAVPSWPQPLSRA